MHDPNDRPRFVQLMAALGETFGREVSHTLASIYFKAFAAWDIDTFDQAVTQAVLTCKFFPKPVELIELIQGTAADHTALADEAWRQLWKAVTTAGTYRSLFCEDRVLAETVRQVFGDYPATGMIPRPDSDDGPMYRVRQKEFVTAYLRLLSRREPYEPYLMGRIEAENDPKSLALVGQGQLVTYLPRTGAPEAVELRALMPDHPLVALTDALERKALPTGEEDLTMRTDDDTRPTTPLDEVYAALVREQPDNDVLWERILARAKAEPVPETDEAPAGVQQRKDQQKQRAVLAGLLTGEPHA